MSTRKRNDPKAQEKANAFRTMALQLAGELEHEPEACAKKLARVQEAVVGIERYSPLNQLLILTQCPDVSEVHGYSEWLSLGYQVRKGETSIGIRAPHTRGKTEEGEERVSIGFHRAAIFDRSQVEPLAQEQAEEQSA